MRNNLKLLAKGDQSRTNEIHASLLSLMEKRANYQSVKDIPGVITWREFSMWFQLQGEARDKVHDAHLYHEGNTRMYEDKIGAEKPVKREITEFDELLMAKQGPLIKTAPCEYLLTKKRTERKVKMVVPIESADKFNLLFIVFENQVANFYNVDEVDEYAKMPVRVHQLKYNRELTLER